MEPAGADSIAVNRSRAAANCPRISVLTARDKGVSGRAIRSDRTKTRGAYFPASLTVLIGSLPAGCSGQVGDPAGNIEGVRVGPLVVARRQGRASVASSVTTVAAADAADESSA